VWDAIFTNFILAVGLETRFYLLPIATSLTACIPAVVHENCHHCRALGAAFFLPIQSRLTRQLTAGHPHRQQLGSRSFVHRWPIIHADRILADTEFEAIRPPRLLLRYHLARLASDIDLAFAQPWYVRKIFLGCRA